MMTDLLSFEHPPVREVTLALMLQPMPKLQTMHLAPLQVDWRPSYPVLQEVAPLAPWSPADSDVVELVQTGNSWPMGLCTFKTASGAKAVRFQHDRFILKWDFDNEEESQEYPGFDALRDELLEKFDAYAKLAHDSTGAPPVVMRVDVTYSNHLRGISAQNAIAGLVSGWRARAEFPFREPDYCGFRVRYNESESHSQIGVLVGIDSAAGESANEEETKSSTLTLDAEADIHENADYIEALESAHDVITAAFLDVTSSKMQETWGRVS